MRADQIIIEPILTEKTNGQREGGVYVFRVDPRANKIQIREAVNGLFNVHSVDCRIVNVKSKPKRQRNRVGRTAQWKKAIITLAQGEKISVFEGV